MLAAHLPLQVSPLAQREEQIPAVCTLLGDPKGRGEQWHGLGPSVKPALLRVRGGVPGQQSPEPEMYFADRWLELMRLWDSESLLILVLLPIAKHPRALKIALGARLVAF